MSDASEVKRWTLTQLDRLSSNSWENPTFVSSQDHDRIVAELKAEIEALKRSELVNQIKGGQDYGDALDEIANLKRTLARRDRVIEKLREQRERYAKDMQEVCGTPNLYKRDEQELEAVEQGEGT